MVEAVIREGNVMPNYFWIFFFVVQITLTHPGMAQSNEELNGSFQFNFHTPGARSLSLGRAFIARADDATAAYANPACLIELSEPGVAIEGRNSHFSTLHVDGGRANGNPTGLGIDTVSGPIFSETERDTTGVSFASFVYPVSPKLRAAVYRHELANFKAAIDRSEGIFFELPRRRVGRINHSRVLPVQASLDLDVVNNGVSVAYELTEWGRPGREGRRKSGLWLGLGISFYEFELRSVWEGFAQLRGDPDDPTELSFDHAVFTPENSLGTRLHHGNDQDLTLILGLLWKDPSGLGSVGLVYRQGPEFGFSAEQWSRPLQPDGTFLPAAPCGQLASPALVPCGALDPERGGTGSFKVPDVVGLGVALHPRGERGRSWLFSFEVDRVTYSDLQPSLNVLGIAQSEETSLSEFMIEDGTEYHLGVEKKVERKESDYSFRAGVWLDPTHQLEFNDLEPLAVTNADGVIKPTNDAVRLEVRFPGADDDLHWTAGIGITRAERYWLDAGIDISDRTSTFTIAFGVHFPGWRRSS